MKEACIVLLMFYSGWASAQTTESVTSNQDPPIYNDVSGTPYVLKDWKDGIIRFSSGRTASQFKIKFDCLKNQLMLQFEGKSFATQSKVNDFVIYTKSAKEGDSLVFKKNFPVTDKANEETFYEVIVEGKASLLCLHLKNITEEQQIATKVIYRRIRDENVYYLLKEKKMIELPFDKVLILEKFTDNTEKLRQFITEQQLKFRDTDDFKKLVAYYNTL